MKNMTSKASVIAIALSSPAFAALYTSGHGDIGVGYEDEGSGFELHPHWHLGPNAVVDTNPVGNAPDGEEFDAGDITAEVASSLLISMPNDAALIAGTGVAAGGDLWRLPQSEIAGVPFLGIATEELGPADWTGDITFELGSVTSPTGSGNFSIWQTDGLGTPTFYFSTANEAGTANGDNTVDLAPGAHAHYNYGFSEAGDWDVELIISGTHVTDGLQTATETFSFNVVPEPTSALLGALGALSFVLRRNRRA